MTHPPSLAVEYADPTPLQIRIATHRNHSEQPDDPIRDVLDMLGLAGAEDIADIGCGDGRFLFHVHDNGHTGRLVGVDTSPKMVAATDALPGVTAIIGDAQQLPLDDDEFDICTARHMLYHVPEPLAALSEFKRVTKPGGVVAVVVNHARTCHRTHELVAAHARSHGIAQPTDMMNPAVNSDSLPGMMHDVFGNTAIRTTDNALVFTQPEPLIAFAEALFTFCGITPDHPSRAKVLDDVTTDIRDWFAAHPGQRWRDPKGYTVITANVTE